MRSISSIGVRSRQSCVVLEVNDSKSHFKDVKSYDFFNFEGER